MVFPFASNLTRRRDEMVAIALGARVTKAVHLVRKGESLRLRNYVLQSAPVYGTELSVELLAEHLKSITQSLGASTRRVTLVISMERTLVRNVDLPSDRVPDMRRMISLAPKNYFQEELPDYLFDCFILRAAPATKPTEGVKPGQRFNALVGGAKRQLVTDLQAAAEAAGLVVDQITLSQIGLANAAALAMPDLVEKEVIAAVDLGFVTSTISILVNGEPALTRVVGIGADKVTSGLAELMSINYPAAEAVKLTMPDKVQAKLQTIMAPLGQELRAAIEFFEHQYDKTVSQVFVSGGSARSHVLVQNLQTELIIPCHSWNPTSFLALELPKTQAELIEKDGPQLVVAIGAAATWFHPGRIWINLLADQIELMEQRRRDPVRRSYWVAGFLVLLVLLWAGYLRFRLGRADAEMNASLGAWQSLERVSNEILSDAKKTSDIERTVSNLGKLATNRFRWALPLNALEHTMVDGIQVIHLRVEQNIVSIPAVKVSTNALGTVIPAKPAMATEKVTLTIQAKDSADPPAVEKYIQTLAASPYFKQTLAKVNPIRLKERLPPQVDPLEPTNTFVLFTLECTYAERTFVDE